MLITLSIMNTLLRFLASASLVTSLCTAFAVGCAAPDDEADSASSTSDITGTLVQARACAIRDAYIAADVSDFHVLPNAEALPFRDYPTENTWATYATFDVPGVGTVYYIERTTYFTAGSSVSGQFYDAQGNVLAGSLPATMQFWSPQGGMLTCSGPTPGPTTDASHPPIPHPMHDAGPITPPHIYDASHE